LSAPDILISTTPKLMVCAVYLAGDSTLWGGYGGVPGELPLITSDQKYVKITFALDYPPFQGQTKYRYRLNSEAWSKWDEDTETEFFNLPFGHYTFEVQAIDAAGRMWDGFAVSFTIDTPFYFRWYMILFYLLLIGLLVYKIIQWRLRRLEKEKMQLEQTVKARTEEVVKQRDEIVAQKDEIEVKSKSLEKALSDLEGAQNELIRQERMATVGKLTQGLIDRILNPMNYINNFSVLSEGLVKDLEANVKDEKEHMDADNYEDTVDLLSLLSGNLQKVSEHGQNATRTLKAMEEMLKDRSGGVISTDLAVLLRQNEEMLHKYFEKEIKDYNIQIQFSGIDSPLPVRANPEQLSKTMMSMLGNSIYALVKKYQHKAFAPQIRLEAAKEKGKVQVRIYDNGIGIEETILDKIFDPFFTTKTTGEASGVGLYLSKEIVQNYGGDITARSVKDEFTEFTIILPLEA
nr:GHKL domain-containing protein [Prevotella sp.]